MFRFLIERGGGTGPEKPGNLHNSYKLCNGAKSCRGILGDKERRKV